MIGDVPSNSQKSRKLKAVAEDKLARTFQQLEVGQVEFVLTELDMSITFCKVALTTDNPVRRARNIESARKGYAVALRFSQTPDHDLKGEPMFQQKVGTLRDLLFQLGQKV